jgi:hypothetical protein
MCLELNVSQGSILHSVHCQGSTSSPSCRLHFIERQRKAPILQHMSLQCWISLVLNNTGKLSSWWLIGEISNSRVDGSIDS